MQCPECGRDEFEMHTSITDSVVYTEDAVDFDEWGEMETEQQVSQVVIKCASCGAVVLNQVY